MSAEEEAESMRCRLLVEFAKLQPLAAQWDRLAAAAEFPTVFLSWGFNRAWWRAFGGDKQLRVVVVSDDGGNVRLIAPLYEHAKEPGTWRFIADFSGDYNDLVMAAGDRKALAALFGWLRRQSSWRELVLERIPSTLLPTFLPHVRDAESSRADKLRAWLSFGTPLVYRVWNHEHPHISGPELTDRHDLLRTKNYVRHVNWYRKSGELRYRSIGDAGEIRKLLPAFMDLHTREWSTRGAGAQFKWDLARQFFENMLDDMAPYGCLRLDMLEFNGAMIAAHFGFVGQGRFYFYKPCMDLEQVKHSPGKLLMAYMIRDAIDAGLTDFDLLRGLDSYKDRYATQTRRTASLSIQRSRTDTILKRIRAKGQ